MKPAFRFPLLFMVITLVLGTGFVSGIIVDHRLNLPAPSSQDTAQAATPDFNLIQQAWDLIQNHYVDRTAIQSQALTYGAISGMVNALGDTGHTRFLTPEMVKQENNFTRGQFDGIGIEVGMKNNQIVILAPIAGSPAQKAGLHSGEIIVKVDGQPTTGMALDAVAQRILGPAGTTVTLTIEDPTTSQDRNVTIQRAHIQTPNITWKMLPGTTIAQIHMLGFSEGVTNDLINAINAAEQQGATGLILDLRDNPGGLLDESVRSTSQFLTSNDAVLLEKDSQGHTRAVKAQSGGVATKIPMVVLVNNSTASAAEILAGALQDAGRAKLVGDTTFGTGTVLNQFSLPDGSAILLATEEWLTPKGRVIWHKGIVPDVQVSLPQNVDPLFPETEDNMTHDQLMASKDTQLLKALQLIGQ
jgi:carboxyl-terminal processing protease